MAKYSRGQTDGLEVALAIHLGIYCAAAACFAFGFYALLQPSRHPSSGLSAYKPPPAMVVTYLPSYRNGGGSAPTISAEAEAAKAEMAEAEMTKAETTQTETVKSEAAIQEARAEAARRQRAANARREKREREARMEYAGQPSFGGYRPWF